MIKKWLRRSLKSVVDPVLNQMMEDLIKRQDRMVVAGHSTGVAKEMQILLQLKYKEIHQQGLSLPSFDEVQLRAYSQSGEDGVLLYIFSLIGTTNKKCVEICAASGIECNSANLIIHHEWQGLLVDGSEKNVKIGREFYASCKALRFSQPKFQQAWITTDSVGKLIRDNGFDGPVDLLTIDIDGNDYWVWEAIENATPRVVVAEFQHAWGPDHSVTQKYDPNFVWNANANPLGISGVSLPALVKLGRKKGYRLVGVHSCNAFFVRNGLGEDVLPEIAAEHCFNRPINKIGIDRREAYEREHGSLVGKDWVVI